MEVQSLSIVIPTKRCMNNCPFCVSKMHDNPYAFMPFDSFKIQKRLKYAVAHGVTDIILTGTGEAIQNKKYLENIARLLKEMNHPFPKIELQTTGVLLDKSYKIIEEKSGDEALRYPNLELLKAIGVDTISLSVSNIFDDQRNMELIGAPSSARFSLRDLIILLKEHDFNVRLSMNMNSDFNKYNFEEIMKRLRYLNPEQITFRRLYEGGTESAEDIWVRENRMQDLRLTAWLDEMEEFGTPLYPLPYGPIAYSVNGMSTVIDNDCMSKENENVLKYLILRENGKLYCRWDDEGSLIF